MACFGSIPTITYATIGSKWQIVIPKEARDKLHVWPWDKVVLVIDEGRMMVINHDDIQSMIQVLQQWINEATQKDDSINRWKEKQISLWSKDKKKKK